MEEQKEQTAKEPAAPVPAAAMPRTFLCQKSAILAASKG